MSGVARQFRNWSRTFVPSKLLSPMFIVQYLPLTLSRPFSLSRDSAVGIAAGYGLDDQEVGVRVTAGSRTLSSPRRPDWF
jgi:hypothetical protein